MWAYFICKIPDTDFQLLITALVNARQPRISKRSCKNRATGTKARPPRSKSSTAMRLALRNQTRSKGGLAHCTLAPGQISAPVRHRSVAEIWFTLAGRGTLWRRDEEGKESLTELYYGVEIEITKRTAFQFRSTGDLDLEVLLLTIPKWQGPAEAEPITPGCWQV